MSLMAWVYQVNGEVLSVPHRARCTNAWKGSTTLPARLWTSYDSGLSPVGVLVRDGGLSFDRPRLSLKREALEVRL